MLETFGAASHDEVLQLVVQIAVLLFAARLLGGIATRLGQPSVVGEILAGVTLGPSLLSSLSPFVGRWILPQTAVQGYMLEVVALIGVMLLLIITGLETDLGLIRRKATTAVGVAIGGLVLPFATGLALGWLMPEDLIAASAQRTVFALFLATALSISAIPVLAKVLMDLDLMRRDIGQALLAAGMIDDITGWTLLGLVTALAAAGVLTAASVLSTAAMVLVFLVGTATVGAFLVNRGLALVQDHFRGRDHILTFVVVMAFAWGAFTQTLRLEPVLGAFAVGILFGRSPRLPAETVHKLESMALGVFAPIFFAVAGLKVDVSAILEPRLLGITLLVIAVATFGKVAGAYAGARLLSGQDHWSALAFGAGLNARGAVEIIIATIGLSAGILSQEVFSMVVVMAIVTSLMAPFGLRFAISRIEMGAEEKSRLQKEEALADSFVGHIRRMLIPVRAMPVPLGYTREMQATLIQQLAKIRDMSVTLFTVTTADQRQVAGHYLGRMEALFDLDRVSTRVVVADDPVQAILAEAEKDYDLMVLGTAAADSTQESIFGRTIDDLVKLSPCPTMLVRGVATDEAWAPRRILVPTNGTQSSRRATELAFAVAGDEAEVTGIHIVSTNPGRPSRGDLAVDVTAELERVGLALGHAADTKVRRAVDPETGVLEAVEEFRADLLVLGTSVRAGTARLYLGPRVEYLARHAPCPVVIVNS
ncbi:MAG TPA: cation:proton antiporter [Acidimicrobiia bacterium]|nr:cation:proton antiporter [Acidimicrobiia bacterium]